MKPKEIVAAGIVRVPRTVGVERGLPLLDDGQVLAVANVIWCTGYRQDLSWVDLPIFGEDGAPTHERGVVTSEPGLYFVGLPFQYSKSSDVLPGIGRDHAYIARHIASRSVADRSMSPAASSAAA